MKKLIAETLLITFYATMILLGRKLATKPTTEVEAKVEIKTRNNLNLNHVNLFQMEYAKYQEKIATEKDQSKAKVEAKKKVKTTKKQTKKIKKTNKIKKIRNKIKVRFAKAYLRVRAWKSEEAQVEQILEPGQEVKIEKQGIYWSKLENSGWVKNEFLAESYETALAQTYSVGNFYITGYCSCEICCGVGGGSITSSGRPPQADHTIAADLFVLPMYTEVYIEGLGFYQVEDVGGGVNGNHIDVYMWSHEACFDITRYANVYIIQG